MTAGNEIDQCLSPEAIQAAVEHGEMTYPQEGCGLFFGHIEGRVIDLFVPCRNIQDDLHRLDPHRYPRDGSNAYAMDDREIQSLEKRFANRHKLAGIFHTHNDVGVYFSKEDRAMACPWGEPLFPDRFYLILGIDQGRIKAGSIFTWDMKKSDFLEHKLREINQHGH